MKESRRQVSAMEDDGDTVNESSHLLTRTHDDLHPKEHDGNGDTSVSKRLPMDRRRQIKLMIVASISLILILITFSMTYIVPRGRRYFRNRRHVLSIYQAQEHYVTIPNTTLRLWYRVWGNTHTGIPVLFVHGGPGNAVADEHDGNARFFRADTFFVVEVDQRGTGQSQPSVRDDAKNMQYYANITIDMIADDYELVREQLGIEQWMVYGGSYGSTVALTYAVRHPDRCSGLILRGIYLDLKREVKDVYSRKAHIGNVKRLDEFDILYDYAAQELDKAHKATVEPDDAEGMLKAYERLIRKGDRHAIWHWYTFENNLMQSDSLNLRDPYTINDEEYPLAQSIAFFETRLWVHGSYAAPNHILKHLGRVSQLPLWICQGLEDEVCPYENAQKLVDTLEDAGAVHLTSRFIKAGHEDTDPVMAKCMRRSVRDFMDYYYSPR